MQHQIMGTTLQTLEVRLEPGVVQPQQWRPDPAVISPDQVTAWCGVARKE